MDKQEPEKVVSPLDSKQVASKAPGTISKPASSTAVKPLSVKKAGLPSKDKFKEAAPESNEVIRKSTIMSNLEKVDGACEYFYILEKENEEIQEQHLHADKSQDRSSEISRELHEMPKGYPQKHQYKPPKIDKVQYQITVDKSLYRGDRTKYEAEELQVYSNQKHGTARTNKRQRRSNSVEL